MKLSKELNQQEQDRYNICNETVEKCKQATWDMIGALKEVRDMKLYRVEFANFEDYCRAKLDLGKSHAYRLIDAIEAKESVAHTKAGAVIETPAQAQALAEVPVEHRVKVIKEAAKSGEVTAQSIKEAAAEVVPEPPKPKKTPKPVLDAMGYRVPEKLVELWKRGDEAQAKMTTISNLKCEIEKLQTKDDPLWAEVSLTGLIADLSRVYSQLKVAKPFAVCTKCQGLIPKNCPVCKGRGLISEYRYNTAIDRQTKDLRLKAIQLQAVAA